MQDNYLRVATRFYTLAIILLAFHPIASAQAADIESEPGNWKTFSSSDGRFSVNFPGQPSVTLHPVETPGAKLMNKTQLRTRALYTVIHTDYEKKLENDSDIKDLLDGFSEGTVDRTKSDSVHITGITFDGNPGRSITIQLKDGTTDRTKVFLVVQRLYLISFVTPSASKLSGKEVALFDAAATQFLDSFKLKAAEETLGEVDRWIKQNAGKEPLYGTCVAADCGPEDSDKKVGGGRILVLPKPTYPPIARMSKASGTVKVQVIIDETGQVIAAQAIDGHPLLFGVSVNAAKGARFAHPKYNGQPAKIIGVLQYNFVTQ